MRKVFFVGLIAMLTGCSQESRVASPENSGIELQINLSLGSVSTRAVDDPITGNDGEGYVLPFTEVKTLKVDLYKSLEAAPIFTYTATDAARPMSVQKKMWNVVKGTSKYKYVSNPNRGGGLHNYGLAVDISIQDSLGQPLPMGTQVDHLGVEAHITDENELVHNGKMSETERQNRILLRKVMKEAGFRALPSEWWHFNFCSRDVAKQKYKLIP